MVCLKVNALVFMLDNYFTIFFPDFTNLFIIIYLSLCIISLNVSYTKRTYLCFENILTEINLKILCPFLELDLPTL